MGAVSGQVAVNGGTPVVCTVEAGEDGLRIGGGVQTVIAYDDIDDLLDDDYTLRVTDAGGSRYEFSMLGRAYGQILADATKRRDESLEKNLLLRGVNLQDTFPGTLLGEQASEPVEATFRVYEDLLVVRPAHGVMFGVPFSAIDAVDWDPDLYQAHLRLDDGTTVTAAKLAKRSEEFVAEIRRLLDALSERTRATLSGLMPGADPASLGALAGLMRDGRAAQKSAVDAIDASLWEALASAVLGSRRDSYDTLAAMTPDGWAAFGVKAIKPAQSDDPADADATDDDGQDDAVPGGGVNRLWFFCPLSRDGAAINAVAGEVTSETGHATYVFRLMAPDRFSSLRGDQLAAEVSRSIARLNRALLLLNFRREPLYASEDEIRSGRLSRYRAALRLLPYLRWARESLLGRIAHTGEWQRSLEKVLDKA